METTTEPLIKQLIALLSKGNAHATFEQAVEGVSFKNVGIKPHNLPYSIWMLVEHLRIAQWDILDFSINPNYKTVDWPGDYWPASESPKSEQAWERSLDQIRSDQNDFINLLKKPDVDLFTPFAHGDGQNLLREALLIADHNSYHTGQVVLIRRLLNDWKG
jgi:hypothetical protein